MIACVRRLLRTKRGSNKLVDTIRNDVRPEVRLQAVRTFILFALQSSACARLLVQTSSVPCLASLCFQGVAETSKARRESTNPLFRWPKAQVRCAATYALQAIVCAIKPHGKYPEEARIFRLHRGFDIVVWHAECGTKNDAYEKRKVDIAYNLRATRFSKMTLMHDIPTEELQRIDAGISGEMGKGGGGQTLIMSRGEAIFNHPFLGKASFRRKSREAARKELERRKRLSEVSAARKEKGHTIDIFRQVRMDARAPLDVRFLCAHQEARMEIEYQSKSAKKETSISKDPERDVDVLEIGESPLDDELLIWIKRREVEVKACVEDMIAKIERLHFIESGILAPLMDVVVTEILEREAARERAQKAAELAAWERKRASEEIMGHGKRGGACDLDT